MLLLQIPNEASRTTWTISDKNQTKNQTRNFCEKAETKSSLPLGTTIFPRKLGTWDPNPEVSAQA